MKISSISILRPSILKVLSLATLLFLGWAAFFEIEQTVRAQGQVIATARTQVIQAADGGVLAELHVHEGQAVRAGDLLATLESDRATAAHDEGLSRLMASRAALVRLQSEISGVTPAYDADFRGFEQYVQVQKGLYAQRRHALLEETSVIDSALRLAQEELHMTKSLMKTGDVSLLEVMRARRQVAELQGRRAAVTNKYLQEARADAAKLEEEISAHRHKLAERHSVLQHTRLTAPVSGVVKSLRITTIGGVLRPGDELMQIAPEEGGYVVEAKVSPADISHLIVGLPATVRLDAFDYTIYGTLRGRVVHVSPDTLVEQGAGGQPVSFYRVHVALSEPRPSSDKAREIAVKLGMSATVDLQTGQRSLLKYLLKPLNRSFDGALRER